MKQRTYNIKHEVANIVIKPGIRFLPSVVGEIRQMLNKTSEEYLDAQIVIDRSRKRHGSWYGTPGYYLHLYRYRAGLTQVQLENLSGISQADISSMEHNRVAIGKKRSKKLAKILKMDPKKLL